MIQKGHVTPPATSYHPLTKAERFCRKFWNFFHHFLTLCVECFVRNYVSRVQKHSLPKHLIYSRTSSKGFTYYYPLHTCTHKHLNSSKEYTAQINAAWCHGMSRYNTSNFFPCVYCQATDEWTRAYFECQYCSGIVIGQLHLHIITHKYECWMVHVIQVFRVGGDSPGGGNFPGSNVLQ